MTFKDKQENLCAAIGLPDLATDDRFAENSGRFENDDILHALLEEKFITRSRHEWWRLLRDVNVPAAPVQTLEEAVAHPQTVASGILQDPPDGTQQVVGLYVTFDCQRRSKSTPLAGVKMHHLMRFSPALAVVPVVHRRDPRCFV